MSRPEVRVKLTPEGVKEVVDAIRQVQNEAKKAQAGNTALAGATRTLRTAMGALGITASVAGLGAMAREAIRTADAIADAAKQFNISTESMSRLVYAGNQVDTTFETLEASLDKYFKKLSEATSGNADAAAAFQQLKLKAAELKSLSPEEQLARIADRISALKDRSDQLRALKDLGFSKDAIGLFERGAEGLRELTEESDRAGATLRESTAAGLDAADSALKRFKASASGAFVRTLGSMVLQFERLGMALGLLERDELTIAQAQLEELIELRDRMQANSRGRITPGQFFGIPFGFRPFVVSTSEQLDAMNKTVEEAQKRVRGLQEARVGAQQRPSGTEDLVDVETDAERKSRSKAQLELTEARMQSELQLLQQGLKGQEDAAKASYDAGIISLQEYFARRRALIESATRAEVDALQRQASLIESAPAAKDEAEQLQRATQLEKLRTEIKRKQIEAQQQLAALTAEESQLHEQLAEQQIAVFNTLDELEGRRHSVFLRNLAQERQALIELLTRAGAGSAEIQQTVDRLERSRTGTFDFEEARRRGGAALEAFNRDAEQIRRDQEAGLITQLEGETRLIELQRQRLALLRELADATLAAAEATGDEAKIEEARQLRDSVAEVEASFRGATDQAAKFRQGFEEGLQSGLQDTLMRLDQIRSLEDALKSLGDTILNVLRQVSAEIVSESLTKGLKNLIGGMSSSSTGGGGGGSGGFWASLAQFAGLFFAKGGLVKRAAAGGQITGPGTGTSDSIPAMLSNGEFVVRAAAVAQPGALQLLRSLNSMQLKPRQDGFASGGLVGDQVAGLLPGRASSSGMHVEVNQTIQAPTREVGRQTAQQAATAAARALASAQRRNG